MREDKNQNNPRVPATAKKWNLRTPEGFGEFFDYFAPKIWRQAYLRTSSREEAEEITSKTFLKVWEYIKKGKKVKSAGAFAYKVADHLVIDFYRSRAAAPIVASTEGEFASDPPEPTAVEEQAKVNYDTLLIKKALLKLKPHEQTILIMRFIDELSIEEISQALGRSRGAVSVAVHRALKELQKVIEEDYGRFV